MTPGRDHSVVVKVGGSLFDVPNLAGKLSSWLAELGTPYVILIPGGGATADVVRDLDRAHQLGEEKAHWLALRSLTLNAHFLAKLLPRSTVAGTLAECAAAQDARRIPIIDAWQFALEDESHPGRLPHIWAVTSDSIAARLAIRAAARALILLKSVTIPAGIDWADAGRAGFVDRYFGEVIRRASFKIAAVNLRDWPA